MRANLAHMLLSAAALWPLRRLFRHRAIPGPTLLPRLPWRCRCFLTRLCCRTSWAASLPLGAGVVFAAASRRTAGLLRPLDALLDRLTREAEQQLTILLEHGLVLPISRQPLRPVYILDVHMAPNGLAPLCGRYYGLSFQHSADLGEVLEAAGTTGSEWPLHLNTFGPVCDPAYAAAVRWVQDGLRVQAWLPDFIIPAVPTAYRHLFPYVTALYRHWPGAGTEGSVMALYIVHGNLGVVLLFFEPDGSSDAASSGESSLWEVSDYGSDTPWWTN